MSEHAIEARDLRKVYAASARQPEKLALDGVEVVVPRGCVLGLLGPNGAGKSTFINILAGLTVKSAGSVRIWGFDQDRNPRMSRASIGVVPQELNIDPFLTPGESLEMQAGLYGVPKARRRTSELLAALGLSDKADAYARTLSGGMRRRLLVAKAMVHSPPVLVLDEPTAGVDLELRRQLWDYVRALNAAGTTIILTTHYLEEAEEMCDRIAIIHHGRKVADGPTERLLAEVDRKALLLRPAGPFQDVARLAARLPDGASIEQRPDGTLAIGYRRRTTPVSAILEAVSAAGVEIADLRTEDPDLEDVFLEATTDRASTEQDLDLAVGGSTVAPDQTRHGNPSADPS